MNDERTNIKRRSKTFKAVTRIHGGSPVMTTLSGLVDTVTTKFSEEDLVKAISEKPKLCEKVFPKIYNHQLKEFVRPKYVTQCLNLFLQGCDG